MRAHIARKLARTLVSTALVAVTFLTARLVLGDGHATPAPATAAQVQAPDSPVAAIVDRHDCWTG